MAGVYDPNGNLIYTLVDGNTYVGIYNNNGTFNAVDVTESKTFVGLYHPSGAYNVVIDPTATTYYADNGAINVGILDVGLVSPIVNMIMTGTPSAILEPWGRVQNLLGDSLLAQWDVTKTDSITLATSAVTSLQEIISGTAFTPGATTNRPTYNATSFNGGPGITFVTDDELHAEYSPWFSGATAGELWAVLDQTILGATAGDGFIISIGSSSGGATARSLIRRQVTTSNRATTLVGNGTTPIVIQDTVTDFSGRCIIRVQFSPTTTTIDVNDGTPASGSVVPATGTVRTVIGANSFLAGFGGMVLSTIILTDPLDNTTRDSLRSLLEERI